MRTAQRRLRVLGNAGACRRWARSRLGIGAALAVLWASTAEVEAQRLQLGAHQAIFAPLVADPKEIRSFVSYQSGRDDFDTNIVAVGLGDRLGLWRSRPGLGVSVRLEVTAGFLAQFNANASSFDLINNDFIVGVPLSVRLRGFGARLRYYHQSSHLGDDALLAPQQGRENLSFESLEALLAQNIGAFRAYAGWEVLVRREPRDLQRHLLHAGVELHLGPRRSFGDRGGRSRLLLAADGKCAEERNWRTAWSGRAGFAFGGPQLQDRPSRHWLIAYEFYDGPSPYGQFFRDDIRFSGVGLHLWR